jgi:hypothetical protein
MDKQVLVTAAGWAVLILLVAGLGVADHIRYRKLRKRLGKERTCETCVDGGKPSRVHPCSDCRPPDWQHWRVK